MPIWLWLTVRHGKIHPFLGKPSISMGHLYHGYVSHNQRVYAETSRSDSKRFQRNSKGLWLWHDIFWVNQRYKKKKTPPHPVIIHPPRTPGGPGGPGDAASAASALCHWELCSCAKLRATMAKASSSKRLLDAGLQWSMLQILISW